MSERQVITEADKAIIDGFYANARKQTLETLPEFLRHLMEDFSHDYGTICHAISAGASATAWAMDKHPEQGGITGFQSGFIMWGFLRGFNGLEGPMRLVTYDNLLFPQYERKFGPYVSRDTWKWVQEQAQAKLAEADAEHASPEVTAHWQSITRGEVPFGLIVSDND